VSIRHSLDTRDAFYDGENNFMDEMMPHYEGLLSEFYHALHASSYRIDLSDAFGQHLFDLVDVKMKTFRPEVLEDLQAENKLCSEYVKLLASARIPFEGEDRNLSQMGPFSQSKDRAMRMLAQKAVTGFFAEHEMELDRIYDELVRVRTTIAKKLGFGSFVELGYARMNRTDYDAEKVNCYRDQILDSVVPVTQRLRERQAGRLRLEALKYYDEALSFLSGNAIPKGSPDWMTAHATDIYYEMSEETDVFFKFMRDHGLLDLVARPGKAGGGYCTFIADEKAPFIFSNFNGTSDDVDVLTHEAGHAFAAYESRNAELPEYLWPTLEACEIHSMSMEFLAWPWMDRFFQGDTGKYKFAHLSGCLLFIPYGVTVDEFQHWVYENPDATPELRKSKWRDIERKYLPHRDYEGNGFLERGGFWFRQSHIFTSPFYYIDYTLAQISAFEFWTKAELDRSKAWADYLRLCQAGGSRPYLELLELAGLCNPFEEGSVAAIMGPVMAWLDGIDDTGM
jgi:M3 family oligoendopeptidase